MAEATTADAGTSFKDFNNVKPQMKQLMNWVALEVPNVWYEVGVQLYITPNVLDGIRSCGGDSELMFSKTFEKWKRQPHSKAPFNWETILKALVTVGKVAQAHLVLHKLQLMGEGKEDDDESDNNIRILFDDHITFMESLNNNMADITKSYVETSEKVHAIFREVDSDLREVTNNSDLEKISEVKTFKSSLEGTKKAIPEYLKHVRKIFDKAQQESDDVIKGLLSGNRKKLDKFIKELKSLINDADTKYDDLIQKCQSLSNDSNRASIECDRLAKRDEERTKDTAIAGTATMGALGVAAILTGIFTAGIGTAVCAGLGVATAAAGGTTIGLVVTWDKSSAQFKRISRSFCGLVDSTIVRLQNHLHEIKTVHGYARNDIIATLRKLDKTAKECYKEMSEQPLYH